MLTVKEAAQQLGVSVGLIYGLCAAGKLRHEALWAAPWHYSHSGRGVGRIPQRAVDWH